MYPVVIDGFDFHVNNLLINEQRLIAKGLDWEDRFHYVCH